MNLQLGEVRFVIPGPPKGKGRPRMGKGGRVYTPADTRAYEEKVKLTTIAAVRRAGWPLGEKKATFVKLEIFVADRRRRDIDNVAKAALDAMNGAAYADDSCVDELHVYRDLDVAFPRVEVTVSRLAR